MYYRFGECQLNTEQYVLDRAGHSISLQPKVFQVLEYLLRHRDRVVSKQELCEQVWPEQFISDASIEGVIKATLQVVGHDGRTQWCIQTRRGQGYRFIAPLIEAEPLPADATGFELAEASDQMIPGPSPSGLDASAREGVDASRRYLTVLSCELVEARTQSTQLDPEDWRDVVMTYHDACGHVVEQFGGVIAQHLDHGLLVYFGIPHAYEDNAQRAVRAGLGLLQVAQTLEFRLEDDTVIRLTLRVGLHTGTVVSEIRNPANQEPIALGAVPTIAVALQRVAEPDTLVMSAATQQLVDGFFTCKYLGEQALPRIGETVAAYGVLRESDVQSRLDLSRIRGLTPLVGRSSEVTLLQERWDHAQQGRGQVVLLGGEPGIGKSRLAHELQEYAGNAEGRTLEFRCSPYHVNSAFYPVIDYLHRRLQFDDDQSPQEKLDKLEQALLDHALPMDFIMPLVAAFLSLPTPTQYPPLTLNAERQKQLTQDAIVEWLLAEAESQPILMIWEDLHWMDPSTQELLLQLIDQIPTAQVLCLILFRSPFEPFWPMRSHLMQMTLNRLSRSYVHDMIHQVAAGVELPESLVEQVIEKTDGVPMFVEALVAMLLESHAAHEVQSLAESTRSISPLAIPVTLQDSLMARLDQLQDAKEIAQLGAVLGREFSYTMIQTLSTQEALPLQNGLARLVQAELLYQRGQPPRSDYSFKHSLIQDAAYASLLRSTRQHMHRQVAELLEGQFSDVVDTQPELVAHHYTEAGLTEPAIGYWHRAGRQARQRSANSEAINHLLKGLELLSTLPDTINRAELELDMQITLGPALLATRGYAAPELERAYRRAQELCGQLGDRSPRFPVLAGLYLYYLVAGPLDIAYELAVRLVDMGQGQTDDPTMLQAAQLSMGEVSWYRGEFSSGYQELEQGRTLSDVHQVQHLPWSAIWPGSQPDVQCQFYAAIVLWFLGEPGQAHSRMQEALRRARELAHPFSLALTLSWAARLNIWLGNWETVRTLVDDLVTICAVQNFAHFGAHGIILQGWLCVMVDDDESGLDVLRQGLEFHRQTGSQCMRPYFLSLSAELSIKMGDREAGELALDEAFTVISQTGECFWEAELHRLRGELLLATNSQLEAADSCFQQALAVSRQQRAKSLELRAATSLSRLWHQRGRGEEARALLAPLYESFSKSYPTADLLKAERQLSP